MTLAFYKDEADEWRWRVTASSDVVADSAEGYSRLIDARKGAVAAAKEIVEWSMEYLEEEGTDEPAG